MKKLICLLCLFFATTIASAEEWIACEVPPTTDDVQQVAVKVNADGEVIKPIQLNAAKDLVLLHNVTDMQTGTFNFQFINSQGRRSDPSPFDLLAKPSGLSNTRVVQE